MRTRILDDAAQAPGALVVFEDPLQFVGDRLRQWNVGDRALDGFEEARLGIMRRRAGRRRIGLDINDTAIDLAIGRAAVDGVDGFAERPVAQHAAVDERGRGDIDIDAPVVLEIVVDEFAAARPVVAAARDELVHLDNARRRERAGKRRRRARGKGQRPGIGEIEVRLHRAAWLSLIAKAQHVPMLALVDEWRIVNLHELLMAVEVRQRHEQIEVHAGREQRTVLAARCAQRGHRVVHQARHAQAAERRLEPARAHEGRQLRPHLDVLHHRHVAEPGRPDQRAHEPLAPAGRPRFRRQQAVDVGVLDPQIAQAAGRQIVRQGARQHGGVDAASRRARDDIDDDAHLDLAADLAQQVEVDFVRIEFGIGAIVRVEEARA